MRAKTAARAARAFHVRIFGGHVIAGLSVRADLDCHEEGIMRFLIAVSFRKPRFSTTKQTTSCL
jgi:hypothetical protein